MITIGERIVEAIDYMEREKIELALTPTCIALDMTSQIYFSKKKSSNKDYKAYIKKYFWLITYMGLPGILSNALKIPFTHKNIKLDADGFCPLEEIIYHVVRCGLIHSNGLDSKIKWNNVISLGLDEQGNLVLSKNLIWGLIGSIIFSEVNVNEKIADTYWISVADFKYFINDAWGKINIPKKIIKIYTGIEIK
jgi:hypothetical protein